MSSTRRRSSKSGPASSRQEAVERTRDRIVQAAVELHQEVGPARAGFADIALRAGVDRVTVYRHFPDNAALFKACSAHFAAQNPLPDPAAWTDIAQPRERLERALEAVYRYYERAEALLTNVTRDAAQMPEVRAAGGYRRRWLAQVEDGLANDWSVSSRRMRPAVALALEFRTWQLLVRERELSIGRAVRLMAEMVSGVAQR